MQSGPFTCNRGVAGEGPGAARPQRAGGGRAVQLHDAAGGAPLWGTMLAEQATQSGNATDSVFRGPLNCNTSWHTMRFSRFLAQNV